MIPIPGSAYVVGGLVIVIGVMGTIMYYQDGKIDDLNEELGGQKQLVKAANRETEKAKAQLVEMELEVGKAQAALGVINEERRKDNVRYQKDLARIASQRESSKRAFAEYPERFGRIATFDLRRSLRDVCRASGGTPETCKIKAVRPAKTGTRNPVQSDTGNSNAGSTGQVGEERPADDSNTGIGSPRPKSVDKTDSEKSTRVGRSGRVLGEFRRETRPRPDP